MNYEPELIKVELNRNGIVKETASLYKDLKHGTQRAVNGLTRPFLVIGESGEPEIDMAKVDWDAVNDLIILGQVKEWTYGPVDQETLDNIPEVIRVKLVEKCGELYGDQGPLQKSGGGN